MFVSKNRFILKTCGQTTLLCAVQPLIELAKLNGMDKIVVSGSIINWGNYLSCCASAWPLGRCVLFEGHVLLEEAILATGTTEARTRRLHWRSNKTSHILCAKIFMFCFFSTPFRLNIWTSCSRTEWRTRWGVWTASVGICTHLKRLEWTSPTRH